MEDGEPPGTTGVIEESLRRGPKLDVQAEDPTDPPAVRSPDADDDQVWQIRIYDRAGTRSAAAAAGKGVRDA